MMSSVLFILFIFVTADDVDFVNNINPVHKLLAVVGGVCGY